MDTIQFLREATALAGVPGQEGAVADYIANAMRPLCDSVEINALGSVVARKGQSGPVIMLCAHMDEIGMCVTKIEDDGCLRLRRNGGVDPRVLPAHEVIVKAEGGDLFGVVGAKPPHLLTAAEREKAVTMDSLYVDVGYDAATVRRLVHVGDAVVFKAPLVELQNGFIAGKTLDNRESVASMLACAEALNRLRASAQAVFVASVQEEIGGGGARTAAHALNPDLAIAIDATFATAPGSGKFEIDPDKIAISMGPNLHPVMRKKLEECAKRHRFDFDIEVQAGDTATDAWDIQTARDGIPTLLVSIPTRYMHTTVETAKVSTIENTGRLLAHFIDDIAREWGDIQWY